MSVSREAREALRLGTWKELRDANGKPYYYNKELKKTVWDLDKELVRENPASKSTTAAPSDDASKAHPSNDFVGLAARLLQNGTWERIDSKTIGPHFVHRESGRRTRDLAMFLEVEAATATALESSSALGPEEGAVQNLQLENESLRRSLALSEDEVLRLRTKIADAEAMIGSLASQVRVLQQKLREKDDPWRRIVESTLR